MRSRSFYVLQNYNLLFFLFKKFRKMLNIRKRIDKKLAKTKKFAAEKLICTLRSPRSAHSFVGSLERVSINFQKNDDDFFHFQSFFSPVT